MADPLYYLHPRLDRAADQRRDPEWLAAILARPETRLVPVWRGKHLIAGPRAAPRPVFPSAMEDWWPERGSDLALIGLVDGVAYLAIDISRIDAPNEDPAFAGRGAFVDLRTCGPAMALEDGSLLAHARLLTGWHARARYCGICGHPTAGRQAGTLRQCLNPDCAAEHFPRVDPAVIVLVHDGRRLLLGRQHRWPRGMHSVLAGFLEAGENLESCVAREVREEAGVELADIAYFGSQPWPFPQSLMLGFTARAVTTEITIDAEELEHAGWYEPDFLRAHAGNVIGRSDFALPGRDSIARRLVDAWLARAG
jgi:NAD+ diphosphatase